jgi:hypothetical protein
MFEGNFKENLSSTEIELQDVSPAVFSSILQFLYTAEIPVKGGWEIVNRNYSGENSSNFFGQKWELLRSAARFHVEKLETILRGQLYQVLKDCEEEIFKMMEFYMFLCRSEVPALGCVGEEEIREIIELNIMKNYARVMEFDADKQILLEILEKWLK